MVALAYSKLAPQLFNSGLKVAGPFFFLSMQYSAVQTATGILNSKSIGKLSPLPFISLLVNCIVWSLYGVLKSDMTVLIPNGIGVIAGLGCSAVYHKFSPVSPNQLYAIGATIICLSLYLASIRNSHFIGLIGCVLAVILSGSPLATVRTVIAERSTAALPFWTSMSTWCNALSWFLYGSLIARDPMIYGPNGMGLGLASLQLILYGIYGLPPNTKMF